MLFNYILEWGEARAQFDAAHPLNLVFVDRMKYHFDAKNGDVLTLADGRSKSSRIMLRVVCSRLCLYRCWLLILRLRWELWPKESCRVFEAI